MGQTLIPRDTPGSGTTKGPCGKSRCVKSARIAETTKTCIAHTALGAVVPITPHGRHDKGGQSGTWRSAAVAAAEVRTCGITGKAERAIVTEGTAITRGAARVR